MAILALFIRNIISNKHRFSLVYLIPLILGGLWLGDTSIASGHNDIVEQQLQENRRWIEENRELLPEIMPLGPISYGQPSVSCSTGTRVGTIRGDLKGSETSRTTVSVPGPGRLVFEGFAKEGHPENGCNVSGYVPSDPPNSHCNQDQQDESFTILLNGSPVGSYMDARDPYYKNYYFDAGPWSSTVSAGSHNVRAEHFNGKQQSVEFRLAICFIPESLPTNTPNPTATPRATNTPNPTATPRATNTPNPTATPRATNTPIPTATPHTTNTPAPTATPFVTNTPIPPSPSVTPLVTNTPTPLTPTETPITPPPTATPENTPTHTPTPTNTPVTPVPTATLPPDSCNGYLITGWADDPDNSGASIRVTIKIDGVIIGSAMTSGRFYSHPIPNEYKDYRDYNVTIDVENRYNTPVYEDIFDGDGNKIGTRLVRYDDAAPWGSVDYATFRCEPPTTDLQIEVEAWAKTPRDAGSDQYVGGVDATGIVWLEDTAEFKVNIQNSHAMYPAINPVVTINLPDDPDPHTDWDLSTHPSWTCTRSGNSVTCEINPNSDGSRLFESFTTAAKHGTGAWEYELITGYSIVSGTYLEDNLEWETQIRSDTAEEAGRAIDNDYDMGLEVVKNWEQVVPHSELMSQYNHIMYHDSIVDQLSDPDQSEKSYSQDDLIPSQFQIPIYESPGITMTTYTTLTVRFCAEYDAPNCDLYTAMIEGMINLKRYDVTETVAQVLDGGEIKNAPSATNIQTGPISIPYGLSGGGRFVDHDPVHCREWTTKMASKGFNISCIAPVEQYSAPGFGDSSLYEWQKTELFGLMLYTRGSGAALCEHDVPLCVEKAGMRPGIYRSSGIIYYEVIYYDDTHKRLGDDPYPPIPGQLPFTVYNQQVSSFIEREN